MTVVRDWPSGRTIEHMSEHLRAVPPQVPKHAAEWWETATWYTRWKAVHAQRGDRPHHDDMQVLLADSERAAYLVVTAHQAVLKDRENTRIMTEIFAAGIAPYDWRRDCKLVQDEDETIAEALAV